MRTTLIAAVLVLALAPPTAGYHLSAGSQDSIGLEPEETPKAPDVSDELYQRGIGNQCADTLQAPGQSSSDSFCGDLVYNGDTDLVQVSPPDQRILPEGWTFDVVVTQYVGTYDLDTCYPWCAPGGEVVYEEGTGTTNELAPNVFSASHEDEDDPQHQSYAVDLRLPNAAQLVTGGDEAPGSGWMLPTTDPQFVGFLLDRQDNPVDPVRLANVVSVLQDENRLAEDAIPTVCGFSPEIETAGPTREAPLTAETTSFCDVKFEWQSEDTDTDFGPSGNDRCASATYVCGFNQPAWYGQLPCKGWFGCQAPHEAGDAWDSTGDYDAWHFVAGVTPSACSTQQAPGVAFTKDGTQAFLAHDLDVYTPATAGTLDAAPAQPVQQTSEERVAPVTGSVDTNQRIDPVRTVSDATTGVGLPDATESETARPFVKPEIPEPNAAGDTSKSITLERTMTACDQVAENPETQATLDPWVDQIDTIQRFQTWNGMDGTQAGLYLNDEATQDENNRRSGMFLSDGKVGIFADRDDDGVYDQAGEANLFTGIREVGAYPMFWDMHLDENLEPAGGCNAGFHEGTIAEAMDAAGYGPKTGMIEAIYLKEPTVVLDRRTGETTVFTSGNNVFLAQSQAIKQLAEAGDEDVERIVDEAIAATGAPASADVVPLDEIKDTPSDFWEQCGEETGRYVQPLMFSHDCTMDCSGDTIVTKYVFEVDSKDGTIGGGGIPAFQPDGENAHSFGHGLHVWTDVDPYDNDPERTTNDGTPEH